MKKLLFTVTTMLALTACQQTRFVYSNSAQQEPAYSQTMHYTWWGKRATIEPLRVCGSAENVAMVEEKEKTGQSWLRYLTIGIYQPVTVSVYCKRPGKSKYWANQPR